MHTQKLSLPACGPAAFEVERLGRHRRRRRGVMREEVRPHAEENQLLL